MPTTRSKQLTDGPDALGAPNENAGAADGCVFSAGLKLNDVDETGPAGVVESCVSAVLAGVPKLKAEAGVDVDAGADGFPRPKLNGFAAGALSFGSLGVAKLNVGAAGFAAETAGDADSLGCDPDAGELALLLSGEGTTMAFNGDEARGL